MKEQDYWQTKSSQEQHHEVLRYNEALYLMNRPSTLYKPTLSKDGNMWCALYGNNLQDGVAGFGESPEKAYFDFDKSWNTDIKEATKKARRVR